MAVVSHRPVARLLDRLERLVMHDTASRWSGTYDERHVRGIGQGRTHDGNSQRRCTAPYPGPPVLAIVRRDRSVGAAHRSAGYVPRPGAYTSLTDQDTEYGRTAFELPIATVSARSTWYHSVRYTGACLLHGECHHPPCIPVGTVLPFLPSTIDRVGAWEQRHRMVR